MREESNLCLSLRATAASYAREMIKEAEEHRDIALGLCKKTEGEGKGSYRYLEHAHRVFHFAARYYSVAAYFFDLAREYRKARNLDKVAKFIAELCGLAYQEFADRGREQDELLRVERLEEKKSLKSGLLVV